MRAAVVQHVPHEGPGMIADALSAAGAAVHVVRVDRGEPLPDPADVGVLVVLGGPMGAFDDADHPHLAEERALIAACVRNDQPVLGVCLGAQLLAAALGAAVRRGGSLEAGTGAVRLTAAGLADAVLGPAGPDVPVVHWHEDTFDLPAGAELLAGSDDYPHQAFRHGSSLGLQFHVELDAAALRRLAPHLPPGVVVDPVRARAAATTGHRLLHRWAVRACSGASGVSVDGGTSRDRVAPPEHPPDAAARP